MVDLPVPSTSSTAAAIARPAANSSARGAAARDLAAQADDNPFQAVLAQELGLVHGGRALPGQGVPSAAAKADSSLKPGEDAAQTAAVGDAPLSPACAGVIPFPPALAGASVSPPAIAGVSPLPTGYTPASTGRATVALDPRQNRLAKESAAANAESQLPAAPAAADFAVPGKLPPSAEGEVRREVAFDTSLLDQHKAAPSAAIHTAGAAPAQVTQAPVAALEARVGERGWDQNLGDKLVWMAGQKQQVAELHLNPPDLGPLKITLTLNNDQASAQFVSAHAAVREAIEMAMPRLREMLADSGITLGNASVSTDAFREQAQPQHEPRAYPAPAAAAAADSGAVTRGERLLRRSHGLVDTFA